MLSHIISAQNFISGLLPARPVPELPPFVMRALFLPATFLMWTRLHQSRKINCQHKHWSAKFQDNSHKHGRSSGCARRILSFAGCWAMRQEHVVRFSQAPCRSVGRIVHSSAGGLGPQRTAPGPRIGLGWHYRERGLVVPVQSNAERIGAEGGTPPGRDYGEVVGPRVAAR